MYLIGLTGGIASGKSTVSIFFKELGCPVIDADLIAREGAEIICFRVYFRFCNGPDFEAT